MRVAIGVVLVIMGVIWTAQGLDIAFAPQSFMTANRIWTVWGIVAILGGGFLIWSSQRNNND